MLIPDSERFARYVVQGPDPHDCWLWIGAVADDGYGRFSVTTKGRRRAVRPQRFAHEIATGKLLTPDVLLMHTCDVPICVHATADASSHLVEGTPRSNMVDRMKKRRHANAATFRWRGLSRVAFAERSTALRDAVKEHGWNPAIIAPLLAGIDPDAPALF